MKYFSILLPWMTLLLLMPAAQAEKLTAESIFDKVIHYEADQLATVPSVNDFKCTMKQTTVQPGVAEATTKEETMFFMKPVFQLYMIGDKTIGYQDQDTLLVLLDQNQLSRERDAKVEDIDCYVISLKPNHPAYKSRVVAYYVAKDDFRTVRIIRHYADDKFDDLVKQIDYKYGPVDRFKLPIRMIAEFKDPSGKLMATTTVEYTDYKFNIGLTVQFFFEHSTKNQPNIPES